MCGSEVEESASEHLSPAMCPPKTARRRPSSVPELATGFEGMELCRRGEEVNGQVVLQTDRDGELHELPHLSLFCEHQILVPLPLTSRHGVPAIPNNHPRCTPEENGVPTMYRIHMRMLTKDIGMKETMLGKLLGRHSEANGGIYFGDKPFFSVQNVADRASMVLISMPGRSTEENEKRVLCVGALSRRARREEPRWGLEAVGGVFGKEAVLPIRLHVYTTNVLFSGGSVASDGDPGGHASRVRDGSHATHSSPKFRV
ncbi:hypothetical protein EV122DRAFT_254031 [Schizophyllum commune]